MEKRIFATYILSGLVFLAAAGQSDFDRKLKGLYKNTVPLIHSADLSKKIHEKKFPIILLDTRSPEEFQISHLPNAILLDYDKFNSKSVVPADKNATIIVYCSVGYRSERVGEKLIEMGYKNVNNLYGGIFDWVNTGETVMNRLGVATDSVHTYNKDWSRWLIKGVKVY